VRRQSELRGDIMKTKQELSRTSAQDQFAKWAKLRRSIDKKLSDLEKLSAYTDSLLRHVGAHPLASHRLESLLRKNHLYNCIPCLPLGHGQYTAIRHCMEISFQRCILASARMV